MGFNTMLLLSSAYAAFDNFLLIVLIFSGIKMLQIAILFYYTEEIMLKSLLIEYHPNHTLFQVSAGTFTEIYNSKTCLR